MLKILLGFILGVIFTLAAVNPNEAKNIAGKAVDTVHGAYKNGVSVNAGETKPAPTAQNKE